VTAERTPARWFTLQQVEATDCYRRQDYAGAASRLEEALREAPNLSKELAARVSIAASWRDAGELDRARDADHGALPVAVASRSATVEAALRTHLLGLRYRRREFEAVDRGLIEAFELVPAPRTRMNGLLALGAMAWRVGDLPGARRCASLAWAAGTLLGWDPPRDLCLALRVLVGDAPAAADVSAAVERLERVECSPLVRQALAVLRRGPEAAAIVAQLGATDEPHELLSPAEVERLLGP
jgi:hypothetical protein